MRRTMLLKCIRHSQAFYLTATDACANHTHWVLSLIGDIGMLGELIPRRMTRSETNDFTCWSPPRIYLSQAHAKRCVSSTGSHAWTRESQLVTLLRNVVEPLERGTLLEGVDHWGQGLRLLRPAHGLLTLPLACACNVTSQPSALDPPPYRPMVMDQCLELQARTNKLVFQFTLLGYFAIMKRKR